MESWIESVFIKRAVLSFVTGAVSYFGVHWATRFSAAGVTIQIDPERLSQWFGVLAMALAQGLHEWLAVKYPDLGKYL